MENTKKKLPFGFYVCCLTYSFERLAYYAAKWGLSIFIVATAAHGGLGLDKSVGAAMSSNLVAFTYITPIIGGYIADRWISPRILVPVGEILMGLGYLCAWRATEANGIAMMWVMIILVSIGTGFFKGNVSGINGRLFPLVTKMNLILYSIYSTCSLTSDHSVVLHSFHWLVQTLDTVQCSLFAESSCLSTVYGGSLE